MYLLSFGFLPFRLQVFFSRFLFSAPFLPFLPLLPLFPLLSLFFLVSFLSCPFLSRFCLFPLFNLLFFLFFPLSFLAFFSFPPSPFFSSFSATASPKIARALSCFAECLWTEDKPVARHAIYALLPHSKYRTTCVTSLFCKCCPNRYLSIFQCGSLPVFSGSLATLSVRGLLPSPASNCLRLVPPMPRCPKRWMSETLDGSSLKIFHLAYRKFWCVSKILVHRKLSKRACKIF